MKRPSKKALLPLFETHSQQDDVSQCDYFCCVTYYWMETDPDYEFEAPKWFDFTAGFDEELDDDSK